MTIKELKAFIKDLPDDMPVMSCQGERDAALEYYSPAEPAFTSVKQIKDTWCGLVWTTLGHDDDELLGTDALLF